MHFSTIVSVDIPQIENEELSVDEQIRNTIDDFKKKIQNGDDNIMLQLILGEAISNSTAFSREVNSEVGSKLERYFDNTDDPKYIEFEDLTDELTSQYKKDTVQCVKFPNGLLHTVYDHEFYRKYCVKDGKVYKKSYGPYRQKKRTKKSKRIKVLADYPFNKMYKSFDEFVEKYHGYSFYEEENAYGYYFNPDGKFDWYQIGGRWPEMFLVKEECTDYSEGTRSWCNDDHKSEAPEGYKWVCAARIRDIEWKVMYDWKLSKYTDEYNNLKEWFELGQVPEDKNYYAISDKGISSYCTMVYRPGQSLEEFLKERDFVIDMKYPLYIYSFLDDEEGWVDCEYVSYDETNKFKIAKNGSWDKAVEKYISSLDDEKVLVGVDIHN